MSRDSGEGRLGLSSYARADNVPIPSRLPLPGVRIVSLVAGGWYVSLSTSYGHEIHCYRSFHALDSEGNIRVWGRSIGTLLFK